MARTNRIAPCLAAIVGLGIVSPAGPAAAQRIVLAVDPPTADTNLFWGTSVPNVTLFAALGRLVGNDAVTGEYSADGLARAWEANDDFTTWTFHLHEAVPWHFDYGEVTAEDVAHSYALHVGEDAVQTGLGQLRGAEVEVIDDHTVSFTLDEPQVGFLFSVASRGSMVVYSKAQYDAEGIEGYLRRPAGTEHFRMVERVPGERLVFERVEGHWSGRDAAIEQLEFRWVPEPATKLAMLLSGEAHGSDLAPELHGDAVAAGMTVIESLNPAMQVTAMFNGLYQQSGDPAHDPTLPWADVRVREAMNRALDRETVLDILYDGRAEPLVRYGMDARQEGDVPELEERFEAEYGYDPDRARELLAEAGYPDAFANPVIPIVSSVVPGSPDAAPMAEVLQVFFDEVGLQTEIREMDFASLGALGRARRSYTVHHVRNAPIRPTEVHFVNSYTSTGSPYHGFEDDTIQALIDELRATVDPDERHRVAQEAFTYLFEHYSDMPIASIRAQVVVNPQAIAGWDFPGVTSIGTSHWHLIEPAS